MIKDIFPDHTHYTFLVFHCSIVLYILIKKTTIKGVPLWQIFRNLTLTINLDMAADNHDLLIWNMIIWRETIQLKCSPALTVTVCFNQYCKWQHCLSMRILASYLCLSPQYQFVSFAFNWLVFYFLLSHWFTVIWLFFPPTICIYCMWPLILAHSSPHYSPVHLIFSAYAPLPSFLYPSRLSYLRFIPNIVSFLFSSVPMAYIVYPSLPHTSPALSLSLSAILHSYPNPLSSLTRDPLSSLTLCLFLCICLTSYSLLMYLSHFQ